MSSNTPPGYGYPQGPQNPSGQNPYAQPDGQAYPPKPDGQTYPPQPGYGPPPPPPAPPYGQQPGYGGPQGQQQPWPLWLSPPSQYGGAPAPGTRALASFGDRFVARLIDWGVLLIPEILMIAVFGSVVGDVFVGLIFFGYEAAMLISQHGQTIGKKVMKLRVVDLATGNRPADNAFWARAAVFGGPMVVYFLGSLFALLNCLWQLWDKPFQQCLHDKAAKTVVVKEG